MGRIFMTSDWHFGHDREFIWKVRGFNSVYEMNNTIIERYNAIVQPGDDVYCLGDCMLGNNEAGLSCIKQLKGNIHIIRGNHDTDTRMELYQNCYNIVEVCEAKYLKYDGVSFFLCHYPTMTSNLEKDDKIKSHLINLYGHTHQNTNFYNGIPFCYHVGVDSHGCTPILLDTILLDIRTEIEKCKNFLR